MTSRCLILIEYLPSMMIYSISVKMLSLIIPTCLSYSGLTGWVTWELFESESVGVYYFYVAGEVDFVNKREIAMADLPDGVIPCFSKIYT